MAQDVDLGCDNIKVASYKAWPEEGGSPQADLRGRDGGDIDPTPQEETESNA